ncbi:MAG: HAMP domain-containing sensor histidine kinase [Thermoplasmata archaeon]
MIGHIVHIFGFAFAIIVLIEIIQILPFIEKGMFNKEIFQKMYDLWIVILVGILIIEISFLIGLIFGYEMLQEIVELLGMGLFLVIMISTLRKSVIETEIAQGTKSRLEHVVDKKTTELKVTISELKDTKTAILNMMEDLDSSHIELQKAYHELKTLDDMKDNILANVSHELRTPLTICRGAFELLKDDRTYAREKIITTGVNALDRQNAIIEDLVDMRGIMKGNLKLKLNIVDPKEVIETSKRELESTAKRGGIDVKTSIKEELPKVKADKGILKHILHNLLINAIKFNTKGGEVVIKAHPNNGYLEVSVADTGIGIANKHLTRIFDRFYQIDNSPTRKYGGTGLGLSVTDNLVKAQGGKLWVESEEGKGSTFTFTLPVG